MNPKSNEDKEKQQSQQQPGSQQQQQQSGEGQQYGEGNYKASRDYNRGLKDHVEHHDIEKEARAAAPENEKVAREMEDAEREAASRAKGRSAKTEDDPNVN